MMRTVAAVAAFVAVLSASHATAQSDANGVQPFLTGPHNISYFPYLKAPTLTNATNQKGLEVFFSAPLHVLILQWLALRHTNAVTICW